MTAKRHLGAVVLIDAYTLRGNAGKRRICGYAMRRMQYDGMGDTPLLEQAVYGDEALSVGGDA